MSAIGNWFAEKVWSESDKDYKGPLLTGVSCSFGWKQAGLISVWWYRPRTQVSYNLHLFPNQHWKEFGYHEDYHDGPLPRFCMGPLGLFCWCWISRKDMSKKT